MDDTVIIVTCVVRLITKQTVQFSAVSTTFFEDKAFSGDAGRTRGFIRHAMDHGAIFSDGSGWTAVTEEAAQIIRALCTDMPAYFLLRPLAARALLGDDEAERINKLVESGDSRVAAEPRNIKCVDVCLCVVSCLRL